MKKFIVLVLMFLSLNVFSAESGISTQKFVLDLLNYLLNYGSDNAVDFGFENIIDKENYTIKPKEGLIYSVSVGIATDSDIKDDKKDIDAVKMYQILSNALKFMEKKLYGDEFYKEHLYFSKLDKYEAQIKNLANIPDEYKDAVIDMYAREFINLDNNGFVNLNEIPTKEKINEALSLAVFNKVEKQGLEIKRYLEIFPGLDNNYTFDPKKDTFFITVESQGSELPLTTSLSIDGAGNVKYYRSPYEYGGVFNNAVTNKGKIGKKNIKELFDFIMNKNYFFLLPSDMSTSVMIMDSATEYITVDYNGKSHKIGGYHPYDNGYYTAISDMINKMTESITKKKR